MTQGMWWLFLAGGILAACGPEDSSSENNSHDGTPTSGGSAPIADTPAAGGGAGAYLAPRVPFAAHGNQGLTRLLPAGTQAALDKASSDAYDAWRALYLKQGTAALCGADRWYVSAPLDLGVPQNLTVSEAHGYGMLISVLMAGHDPEAKTHFDGMVRFWRDHPTTQHPALMAWYQDTACKDGDVAKSSTDADLDIALALFMADAQWGSCGGIDYRSEALRVMAAIQQGELAKSGDMLLVSNQVETGSVVPWDRASRSSDFMPLHLALLGRVSVAGGGDGTPWTTLLDAGYQALSGLQRAYAPTTSLLPDFFVGPVTAPAPAPEEVTSTGEPYHNGDYFYNACRVPLRVGMHASLGDERARTLVAPLSSWFATNTAGDPMRILAGYKLDGQPLGTDYAFTTMAFVAPVGVAAMNDPAGAAWLDAIWQTAVGFEAESYYEDTLKLLSMLVMSDNWWVPTGSPGGC